MRRLLGGLVGLLAMGSGSAALAAPLMPTDIQKLLQLAGMQNGPTYEQVIGAWSRPVRVFDINANGLEPAELAVDGQIQLARIRALRLVSFLSADLNNDQRVTRQEYDIVARASESGGLPMQSRFEDADSNGDGVLDWAEMSTFPADQAAMLRSSSTSSAQLATILLAADPTPTTPLTLDDVKTQVDQVFGLLDKNGDHVLEADEVAALRPAPQRRTPPMGPRSSGFAPGAAPLASGCPALPQVPTGAAVVALSAYTAQTLASVYLDAPDKVTYAVTVDVQPGAQPLYFVGTSRDAVIWKFTGATSRLKQVVVGGDNHSGAIGIDKAIFTDAGRNCLAMMSYVEFPAVGPASAALAARLGVGSVTLASAYEFDSASVPDMARHVLPIDRGAPPPVAQLSPEAVVSANVAQAYAVLPMEAGIAQLVASGALEDKGNDVYRVIKPIAAWPANLTGPHAVQFRLAAGVPLPPGSPGHSCVIDEATGEIRSPLPTNCPR